MKNEAMQKFYTIILFLVLFGWNSCIKCPHEPLCDCLPNTGMLDIYCINITTLAPVIKLLRQKCFNSTVNKLMLLRNCSLTKINDHSFENISVMVFQTSCPFSDIPTKAFFGATHFFKFDLNGTTFTTIPNGLRNQNQMKTLNLKYHSLKSLKHELWNLSSLAFLNFYEGNLGELSEDAFSKTPEIVYIDLSYNHLTYLHPDTFKPLQSLQRIYLRGNHIYSADGLFRHVNPEVIDIYDNNITSIDNVFNVGMFKLKKLYIGKNPVNYMNSSSFKLTFQNLQVFDMTAMKCSEVDPNLFASFPKLQQAILRRNKLQNIPKTLFHNLKGLQVVDLSFNAITSIEGLFYNTPEIKTLKLSRNKISKIENSFQNLKKLEKLALGMNNIKVIRNDDFVGVENLIVLMLSHNNIETIESKSFSRLKNLESLELSSNYLLKLNRSLQNLFSLNELFIRSSHLTDLEHDEFWGLTKLYKLNLVDNDIRSLSGVFQDVRNLRSLNIAKNKLTTLTRNTFPQELKLEQLWLANGNKLHCDCRLKWMLKYFEERNHTVLQDNPVCHGPRWLQGKPISSLKIEKIVVWPPEHCPESCKCECYEQGWEFRIKTDCSYKNLTSMPHTFPENLGHLDLSGNQLRSAKNLSKSLAPELEVLNLEKNKITSLDSNIFKQLKEVRLASNLFNRLNWSVFNDSLEALTLSNNPWICDCDTVNFRKWLLKKMSIVIDVNETRCGNVGPYPKLYGKIITAQKDTELCPNVISLYVGLVIGILCLLLVATTMVLAYSRYHLHIKVWLYAHGYTWVKEDDMDTDRLFDALVSCHSADEDFVMREIMPRLENEEPKFTLCFPSRDVLCGEFESIVHLKAITDSRRVIVILTQDYIENAFCMSVFQHAFEQSVEDKVHRVILIKLDEIPKSDDMNPQLKITLESTNCITWEERQFWERLRYAMPKKVKAQPTELDYQTSSYMNDDNDSDTYPLLG